MKLVGIISTAVLSLTLGASAAAYAQQDQHDQQEEPKAKPQEEKKAKPEKPAKQDEKSAQQERNTKPEEKNAKPEENNAKQQEKNNQQEEKQQAKPTQTAQRTGGNGAGRIPDDRFKANFGQQHRFHVTAANYRDRRFQYGGYWFGFAGMWPSNWLYTQDVYVVDIDGVYYLCNASYPGVNIELSVTL